MIFGIGSVRGNDLFGRRTVENPNNYQFDFLDFYAVRTIYNLL